MKASLKQLEARHDGVLDSVHALRDSVGADIVTLVSEDDDSCGIAWSMKGETPRGCVDGVQRRPGGLPQQPVARARGRPQPGQHARSRQHVERRRVRVLLWLPSLHRRRHGFPRRHGVRLQGRGARREIFEPVVDLQRTADGNRVRSRSGEFGGQRALDEQHGGYSCGIQHAAGRARRHRRRNISPRGPARPVRSCCTGSTRRSWRLDTRSSARPMGSTSRRSRCWAQTRRISSITMRHRPPGITTA